jgi:hypothetical protein
VGADGGLVAFIGIRESSEAQANLGLIIAAPEMRLELLSIAGTLEAIAGGAQLNPQLLAETVTKIQQMLLVAQCDSATSQPMPQA